MSTSKLRTLFNKKKNKGLDRKCSHFQQSSFLQPSGWPKHHNCKHPVKIIHLNNACDVFVQLIFPFRLNEGNSVLNCKYELQINLCIGICHGHSVPHGTRKNGLVILNSINILSLTGHFVKKNYHSKLSLTRSLSHFPTLSLSRTIPETEKAIRVPAMAFSVSDV